MLDPKTTAFIFPGQGSQSVGMGAALAAAYPVAQQTFAEADKLLNFPLSELCFEGPEAELNDTANTQPALYVTGIAALRAFYEAWQDPFTPAIVAGHSLGQLTALTAAGSLSFEEGLKLVRRRGELMRDADQHSPGGMAAVLGLGMEAVESVCAAACKISGDTVVAANDNCPGQVVIAGGENALAVAIEGARQAGAKRVLRLPISIAAHSPLMERAAGDFRKALEATTFHEPMMPIIGNTTAHPLNTIDEVWADLSAQLTSAVRWTESVQNMIAAGITTFVELGNKSVLSGLINRIDKSVTRYAVDTPEGIEVLTALKMA